MSENVLPLLGYADGFFSEQLRCFILLLQHSQQSALCKTAGIASRLNVLYWSHTNWSDGNHTFGWHALPNCEGTFDSFTRFAVTSAPTFLILPGPPFRVRSSRKTHMRVQH